jgi:hypothetical protein
MKTAQRILNERLLGIEIGDCNDAIIDAMEEYASQQSEAVKQLIDKYKDKIFKLKENQKYILTTESFIEISVLINEKESFISELEKLL